MSFIFTKLGSTLLVIALIAFGYFLFTAIGDTTIGVTLKTNSDLETGLVGHWTFDGKDMVSNVADVSGQGNHGALQGQTSTTTAVGKIGQGLEFDGTDDYVNIADNSDFEPSTNSISVSAWFLVDTLPSSNREFLITKGGSDSYEWDLIGVDGYNSNSVSFTVYNDIPNAYLIALSATVPETGQWYFVTGVYDIDLDETHIYINGILEGSDTTTFGIKNSAKNNPVAIGRRSDNADKEWDGKVDDVRIYNRALSADEVKRLYDLGR